MRKFWYAGATLAASGVFLFGAAPAQADLLPGAGADIAQQQADQQLADLLGQSNGITLENPLRFSSLKDSPAASNPVMQFKAGQNSPDVKPVLPGESTAEPRPQLPAADVVRGSGSSLRELPVRRLPLQQLPLQQLPLNGLLGGGLPLLGGLNPAGQRPSVTERPTFRQAEAFEGGVPLLGGLGGLLPVNGLPKQPDVTGLPGGGTAVTPATTRPAPAPAAASPAAATPAAATPATPAATPAASAPAPDATPDDPRLHEEPIDDDSERRPFTSEGRPIGGDDPDYK